MSETTINLLSVYEKHRIKLESPEEVVSAQHGKYRVPGTGKEITFNNFKASIPADWMPLLEAHPDALVQRGLVNTVEKFTRLPDIGQGVQVGSGAMAAGTSRNAREPHEGWNEATGKQIGEWITAKVIGNPEAALAYELANRRRKMVVRGLTDAVLGDDPQPDDDTPTTPTTAAPVPAGIGGSDL